MKTAYRIILVVMSTLSAASCGDGGDGSTFVASDCSDTKVTTVELSRLELAAAEYPSMTDSGRIALIEAMPSRLSMLMRLGSVADTVSDSAMLAYSGGRAMKMFLPEVLKVFPADSTWSLLSGPLTGVRKRLAVEFPDMVMPEINTVVSPFNQSVVMAGDTAVYIALNHYLGSGHEAYAGFAGYLRRLKTPGRVHVDVAEALLATRMPYIATRQSTVLSRLLYEGALVEAVMRVAGVDECVALGYTADELKWADDNLDYAWEVLLTRRMLFSTDLSIAHRLVDPGPSTLVLDPDSPGRLGRLIGHRIIAAYIAVFPETRLETMLSPGFYNSTEILRKSGFPNR